MCENFALTKLCVVTELVYHSVIYCVFVLHGSQEFFFVFKWMEEFKSKMLPETDPRYQVVKKVVGHLSESNKDIAQVSALEWVIHVVEEPGVNAFVLPVS